MRKYRNEPIVVNGERFDSNAEHARWLNLGLMQITGLISGLQRQVKYEVIQKQDGERATHYIADFVYQENGEIVVEDVKGVKTRDYIMKRKLMLLKHGIRIREIKA